jgi:predicted metal-binding protein
MQSATAPNNCTAINLHCKGVCSGYGTQTFCPPLRPGPTQEVQASTEGGKATSLLRWFRARSVGWMRLYDDESLEDWSDRQW